MSTIQPSLTDEIRKRTDFSHTPIYLFIIILLFSFAVLFIQVASHHMVDEADSVLRIAELYKYLLIVALALAAQVDKILTGSLAYAYKKYRARGAQE